MQIYLTNLSKYNNGCLAGEWLKLPCTKEELQDSISRVLCLDEEYFITDTDGIPFDVGEHDCLYGLNEKLCVAFLLSEGYGWNYSIDNHEDVTLYADERLEKSSAMLGRLCLH